MSENKPKEFAVYRIYHIDTGKSYIGITGNYKKRMREHFNVKDNCYIHNAIQKHGKEKFITEIIFECDSFEDAKREEREYINVFDTMSPNGYNLTGGGDGMIGVIYSEETCKKRSELAKNRPPISEKTRKRMSIAHQNQSKETRKKISESQKGKITPEETRKKISEALKGKKTSLESCKKMSDSSRIFSKNQILEIRKLLLNGVSQYQIAKEFNVLQPTISKIKCNKRYADIQLPKN